MKSILIVSAEPSSTLYAEKILKIWKDQGKEIKAYGIGSREMQDLGFECMGRSEEVCVMGFAEVALNLFKIKYIFNQIVQRAKANRPDVALLIDYPTFNMKLAKSLKEMGVPVVYYIPPKIWARKKQYGFKDLKKYTDQVLSIFLFEQDILQKKEVKSSFVGNPLLDEFQDSLFSKEEVLKKRQLHGISSEDHVVGLLPGSRKAEIKYNLPLQLEVGRQLYKKYGSKICLMVAPNLSKEEIRKELHLVDYPIILVKDRPFKMLQIIDSALCASGTATLFVALMKKPMVVMYKFSWITQIILHFMLKMGKFVTPFYSLPNLILDKKVVPEILLGECTSQRLVKEISKVIEDSSLRDKQIKNFELLKTKLGSSGVAHRVVKALEAYL